MSSALLLERLSDRYASSRPEVGRAVEVVRGPFAGSAGVVTWYGPDRFSAASLDVLDQARGLKGFRVRVRGFRGTTFFLPATDVRVTP